MKLGTKKVVNFCNEKEKGLARNFSEKNNVKRKGAAEWGSTPPEMEVTKMGREGEKTSQIGD